MNYLALILGMAVVTYLPRLLPALIRGRDRFPAWFRKWLQGIPPAALAALIFPGILQVNPEHPRVGLVGGGAALLLSLLRLPNVWVMLGALLAAFLAQQWM